MIGERARVRAYLAPIAFFFGFLFLGDLVKKLGDGYAHWAVAEPQYWIFPLQTFVCAAILCTQRRHYVFTPMKGFGFATLIGLVALAIWIAPQMILGRAPRTDGFDPYRFGDGWPFWLNLSLRILRMVVIVPLVEEIFWRGFLLRYLVRSEFDTVPMGTFTWLSFAITTAAFCFEHSQPDWPAAALTGALFNLVAYRTRSLAACVLTHAITNLALALYILHTKQWGFW